MAKVCVANAIDGAVKLVNNITPSVIVLARVVGIPAKKLAMALFESDGNDSYRAEVAENAIKPAVDAEKARAKAE